MASRVLVAVGLATFFRDCAAGEVEDTLPYRYNPERKVWTAYLYGSLGREGYYYTDVLVGNQTQRTSVVVDTTGSVLGFTCSVCQEGSCGQHRDPPIDWKAEEPHWIRCGHECREQCLHGLCGYSRHYGGGTGFHGTYFEDKLHLGDWRHRNPGVYTKMGCHSQELGAFRTRAANGVIGLSPRSAGMGRNIVKSPIVALLESRDRYGEKFFSLCLAAEGGEMTLGGWDEEELPKRGVVWTPIDEMADAPSSLWTLKITGIKVAGEQLAVNWSGAVAGPPRMRVKAQNEAAKADLEATASGIWRTTLNSHSPWSLFRGPLFTPLRKAVLAHCSGCSPQPSGETAPPCWQVASDPPSTVGFPKVEVSFDGASAPYVWSPESYLVRDTSRDSSWCLAAGPAGPAEAPLSDHLSVENTLGASFMLNHRWIFDVQRRRMGFAPATCRGHTVEERSPEPSREEKMALWLAPARREPLTTLAWLKAGYKKSRGPTLTELEEQLQRARKDAQRAVAAAASVQLAAMRPAVPPAAASPLAIAEPLAGSALAGALEQEIERLKFEKVTALEKLTEQTKLEDKIASLTEQNRKAQETILQLQNGLSLVPSQSGGLTGGNLNTGLHFFLPIGGFVAGGTAIFFLMRRRRLKRSASTSPEGA